MRRLIQAFVLVCVFFSVAISQSKTTPQDLYNQGISLVQSGGDYERALDLVRQGINLSRDAKDRDSEALGLLLIGTIYSLISKPDEALKYYLQALPIFREVKNRPGEATTLNSIGFIYQNFGQFDQALEYYQKTLLIRSELKDRNGEAITLNNIGGICQNLGQINKALENYQRALSIFREVKNRSGEGTTLNNIGLIYRDIGQPDKALEYYQKALSIRKEVKDRNGEAVTLNNIGGIFADLGVPDKTLDYFQRALAIFREAKNRNGEAITLNNLGNFYQDTGHSDQALEYFQQVLVIFREIKNQPGEGAALNNIGGVYQDISQFDKALEYFQRALIIRKEVKDRPGEAVTLSNIGVVYRTLGQTEKALEYYQKALAIQREVKDRPGEAVTLSNIGHAYLGLDQSNKALEYFQQALSTQREVKNRVGEATTLNNIGVVYRILGQTDKALEFYQKSLSIRKEIKDRLGEAATLDNIASAYKSQQNIFLSLQYLEQAESVFGESFLLAKSDEVLQNLQDQRRGFYNAAVQISLEASKPELAFKYSESSRARLFLNQLSDTRPKTRNNSSQANRLRQLQDEYFAKVRLLANPQLDEARQNALRQEIDALEREVKSAFADFQRSDPEEAARIGAKSLDLAGVQQRLEPNVTLVSFHVLEDQVVAFVIGRDRFKALQLPIKKTELQALIADARADRSSAIPVAYSSLYDRLIRPLQADLTTLLVGIVPHDALHDLPFASLRDQERKQWFGEEKLLFSLPSASSYQFIQAKRKTPTRPSVLAVGVQVFNQDQLPALPSAETEAQDVLASPYFAGGSKQELLGPAATKVALLERASSVNVLHLSVHAKVNRKVPRFSRLYLSGQDSLSVADVYDLDLRNASLVVLSACETGVGQLNASDDITSLNRAFIYAGSPSVLASLTTVRDNSTSLLMAAFYDGLAKGLTKAEALQAAQADIRNLQGFENPYFWAYFTLTGDPGK
jgi:CHAT domain-containing protein/Tfp pilus assembly protein PilF